MPYNEIKRPKSANHIKRLFQLIAERHGRRHELVLCERIDIGPRSVWGWTRRGIPVGYWPLVAELAGVTVEEVAAGHRWYVRDHESHPFRLRRGRAAGAPGAAS
jgi:hypothetical protein